MAALGNDGSGLGQQLVDLTAEHRQVCLDRAPHEPMIHARVAVNEDVSKGNFSR